MKTRVGLKYFVNDCSFTIEKLFNFLTTTKTDSNSLIKANQNLF